MISVAAPVDGVSHAGTAGTGSLSVVRHGGRSVVTRAVAVSPLRLLTPRNHGRAAWVYAATYGGGLVGGDTIRLDVSVGPGATAMLSTQAATKVYRSQAGASHHLDVAVSSGALLAILPDPVVPFAASAYRQEQRVRLEAGASLVLLDWLSSGRSAAGERWEFDSYSSRLEVYRGGRLVLLDALSLDRRDASLESRMGRFDVLCAIVLLGEAVTAHAADAVSLVASMPVARRARMLAAASPVAEGGAIVRFAGVSLEDVAAVARDCLRFVPVLIGDDPWARKW